MRLPSILTVAFACSFGLARAENLNLNETAETTMVAISPYCLGLGIGAMAAVNPELQSNSDMFLKLSVAQAFRVQDNFELGMDLDWWLPGINLGGTVNVDYLMGKGGFHPFVGMGVGMQYLDHPTYKFGDNFGIQGTAHVGLYIEIMDEMQMRIRVPFNLVANKDMDRAAGLDIALLFSSPHRNTRVKKLKY